MTRSIVVSGFMATGKSTVSRLVAERLGLPLVDTDDVLAKEAGTSVGALFASEGEARFRDREAELVLPLLSDGVCRVIGFGGGTVTIPRVRHAALEAATVITLTAAPETIGRRIGAAETRPNLGAASPVARARDLLALRRAAYGEAHAAIATDDLTPAQIADRIVAIAARDLLAVPLDTRSYAVELGNGRPAMLTGALAELSPSSLVVVTDTNVKRARGAWLDAALAPLGVPAKELVLTPGEGHKTVASIQRIWDAGLEARADRRAVLLAFGGGVVGDLGGFAASTLLRGVRYVQIATTLLAMVDSSVGGKTGFDHAAGKNLLGSFYQPRHVVLDLEHLTTLPARQRAAGLAEVVKIALVRDLPLLEHLEANADILASGDRDALRPVVRAAVLAKIRVVRDDEREDGIRALLNLGHTIGHALEAHGEYARLLHGEAVAIGTVFEIAASERLGFTPAGTARRAAALLRRFGLPTEVSADELTSAWAWVAADKKRSGATLRLPVVREAGTGTVEAVPLDSLKAAVGA